MSKLQLGYDDFWHEYLRAHASWQTRGVHYAGITLIISCSVLAVATGWWWLVPLALVLNYAGDWIAHFKIERNRPVAFDYPLWSAISALRMFGLCVVGQLKSELRNAGID